MTLECTSCHAKYSIADSLIPAQGARIKCRKCGEVFAIEPPVIELAPSDLEVIPPPETPRARASAPAERPAPVRQPDPEPAPARPEPSEPPQPPQPEPSQAFASPYEQVAPPGISTPVSGDDSAPTGPDPGFERFGAPPALETESIAPVHESAPRTEAPPIPEPAPTAPQPAANLAAPPQPAVPQPAEPQAAASTPIPDGLGPDERGRHEKARRLARVLASDIAIYNREKRDRGIKDGNLVAVLGYEIKKSWEIYKERVTPELANSTPYFRDALNEMLAEGKKIF